MQRISVNENTVTLGDHYAVDFRRTLRMPEDGRSYLLPLSLGQLPIYRVEDYKDNVPPAWLDTNGIFIPLYQREALWINFRPSYTTPCAIKVADGTLNAASGRPWQTKLRDREDDYLVSPPHLWLDGCRHTEPERTTIQQFVAWPAQAKSRRRGAPSKQKGSIAPSWRDLRIVVYEPRADKLSSYQHGTRAGGAAGSKGMNSTQRAELLAPAAAGARVDDHEPGARAFYPDPYGIHVWDQTSGWELTIHLINIPTFSSIVGTKPPVTPVNRQMYARLGLPWEDTFEEAEDRTRSRRPRKSAEQQPARGVSTLQNPTLVAAD